MNYNQPLHSSVTYNDEQAASQIGCKSSKLINLRKQGKGPEYVSIDGEARYRPEFIKRWLMRGAM